MARIGWALVGLVACGGGGTGTSDSGVGNGDCAAGDITMAVGTGEQTYAELQDGDPVTMVHGPQNGWHIWFGVDAERSETEVKLTPTVTAPELGDLLVTPEGQQALFVALAYDDATCSGQIAGQRALVNADRPSGPSGQDFVCGLAGQTLTLSVLLEDILSGRTVTRFVNVTAELDAVDVPLCP